MYSVTTTFGWPAVYSRKVPCRSISGKADEAKKYGLKQHHLLLCSANRCVVSHSSIIIIFFFLENISGCSEWRICITGLDLSFATL